MSSRRTEFAPFWGDVWLTSPACAGSPPRPFGISATGIIEMPAENGHADGAGPDKRSKMDIIESVLEVLESQQHDLDIAGFSMVSIYLNDAIERLKSERDGLVCEPKL